MQPPIVDPSRIGTSSPSFSLEDPETMYRTIGTEFAIWEIVMEALHHADVIRDILPELLASDPMEVQVHVPIGDVNIGSMSDRIREASVVEVIATMELAAEVGVRIVTVHPGHFSPMIRHRPDLLNNRIADSLKRIGRAAADLGVRACLENMPNMPFTHLKEPGDLVEVAMENGLGITYDVGHSHTCSNIGSFLDPGIVKLMGNVHIHDNTGSGDDHMTLGEGSIDLVGVVTELERLGYSGNYIIESRSFDSSLRGKEYLATIRGARRNGQP